MNKLDLKDKVAIITGGAQGFGLAISRRIIQSGGKVVIWDIDEIAVESALKEISSKEAEKIISEFNKPSVETSDKSKTPSPAKTKSKTKKISKK